MFDIESKQRLKGHVGKVWSVDWHPEGNLLASCGEDKHIKLWRQTNDKEWVCASTIITHHKRSLRRVRWSHCGKILAVCSFDGTVSLWKKEESEIKEHRDCSKEFEKEECDAEDTDGWELLLLLEGHENEVKGIDWSVDGEWFASCSRDKSVWVWKANQDSCDYECSSILTSHTQDVKMVVWHPLKQVLYSTSYDDSVKCYQADADDDEWFPTSSFTPHTSTVWCLDFDGSGNRAVTCSEDGDVKVWSCPAKGDSVLALNEWKCLACFSHARPVYHVSWNSSNNIIASACGDNNIRIYGQVTDDGKRVVASGGGDVGCGGSGSFCWEVLREFPNAHQMDINSLSWHPTQNLCLASCGDDEVVLVWRFSSTDEGEL